MESLGSCYFGRIQGGCRFAKPETGGFYPRTSRPSGKTSCLFLWTTGSLRSSQGKRPQGQASRARRAPLEHDCCLAPSTGRSRGHRAGPESHPQRVLPGWVGRVTSATISPGNYVTSTLPFLLVKVISIQAVNCS